jgi:hypothetical protein
MSQVSRGRRRPLSLKRANPGDRADFTDAESQRVLSAAAVAVARELGRQAARECFMQSIEKQKTKP